MGEISKKMRPSLRGRLVTLILVAVIPFLCMAIYLIFSLLLYSRSYDEIVDNMAIANNYNLEFKEQFDESTYKLVVGAVTLESIEHDQSLQNPYSLIAKLRSDSIYLMKITEDRDSMLWLQSLLRNLDTLQERLEDIRVNVEEGGHYDENIAMLDSDIYILTELIQDDLQKFIYYKTQNIESLKKELNEKLKIFIIISTGMMVIAIVVISIITIRLGAGITNPIRNLVGVTGKISKGDFSVRASSANTKELTNLSDAVNGMAHNLEILVEQIKVDERKMRQTELRLLQEQINPHFLYNTLDTIVWLVEGNRNQQAKQMVVSLSDFFRLILNHGKEMTSIEQEEKHIRSYLEIQQVRYQDIMEYEIDIPESYYGYEILKMTLQPIVENALYHGIKYKRAKGIIRIQARMEENGFLFLVEDDGIGMEVSEVEELNKEIQRPCKETDRGFGLANVNERIRMTYGTGYGIWIESEKGVGTKVYVKVPIQEVQKDEK